MADIDSSHTLIFYEAPHRLLRLLEKAMEHYGDRRGAVCMELTKKFERVYRGRLSELIQKLSDEKIRGEAVVVIEGKST